MVGDEEEVCGVDRAWVDLLLLPVQRGCCELLIHDHQRPLSLTEKSRTLCVLGKRHPFTHPLILFAYMLAGKIKKQ